MSTGTRPHCIYPGSRPLYVYLPRTCRLHVPPTHPHGVNTIDAIERQQESIAPIDAIEHQQQSIAPIESSTILSICGVVGADSGESICCTVTAMSRQRQGSVTTAHSSALATVSNGRLCASFLFPNRPRASATATIDCSEPTNSNHSNHNPNTNLESASPFIFC